MSRSVRPGQAYEASRDGLPGSGERAECGGEGGLLTSGERREPQVAPDDMARPPWTLGFHPTTVHQTTCAPRIITSQGGGSVEMLGTDRPAIHLRAF